MDLTEKIITFLFTFHSGLTNPLIHHLYNSPCLFLCLELFFLLTIYHLSIYLIWGQFPTEKQISNHIANLPDYTYNNQKKNTRHIYQNTVYIRSNILSLRNWYSIKRFTSPQSIIINLSWRQEVLWGVYDVFISISWVDVKSFLLIQHPEGYWSFSSTYYTACGIHIQGGNHKLIILYT